MDPTDLELIAAVADRRDRQAFAELFRRHGPRIKGFLLRRGADEAEADELCQEVMLTVWRRARSFDPARASLRTWLFTIARNRWIDRIRRQRRPEVDPEDPLMTPSIEPSPDQAAHIRQRDARLREALDTLPPEQSRILWSNYYEDCSQRQIAEREEVPVGTVKGRVRLAMKRLRGLLEADWESA